MIPIRPSRSRSDPLGKRTVQSAEKKLTAAQIRRLEKFPPINELPVNYIDMCVQSVAAAEKMQHQKIEPSSYIDGIKENTSSEEPGSESFSSNGYIEGVSSPMTVPSEMPFNEEQASTDASLTGSFQVDNPGDLGSGSYGLISSGIFKREGKEKTIAIKSFKADAADRELKVIESLMRDNPRGSVRLYGKMFRKDGKEHIVMKYCNRGSVGNFFGSNFLNKVACYEKIPSLLKVVKAFHDSGYSHRDIHEGNFLVHEKKNGETQDFLVDFGHAVKIGGDESKGTPLNGRELFLMNSPPEVTDLFFGVWAVDSTGKGLVKVGSSALYDEFADHHALAIDRHQVGFMLFRICCLLEYGCPLVMGGRHSYQQDLFNKLRTVKKEIDEEYAHLAIKETELNALKSEAFTEKMKGYLSQKFKKFPAPFADVIVGLLNFPDPMSLEEALLKLEAYMSSQDVRR